MKIASSPDRGRFKLESFLKSQAAKGCTSENDQATKDMADYYKSRQQKEIEMTADPAWAENNLEYDLRTTPWILKKVKNKRYAQNLYAALCNMRWQKIDVMTILKDEFWDCSWRYAGGIIAHMREQGDYIDWYCSGIDNSPNNRRVTEGTVTEEIRRDLKRLGWQPVEWKDQD